ncbi:hypothetical protein SEVIR_8G178100v4 [Setaria viridis]|uniref:uncharacterized protein isoform X2 n=1 Tax=Setaria viridis TaxID=4556 RepID=UPI001493D85A|nr:serine/arginine repetitive matrix protein 1 isoform X2 [Setaria viridis]
MVAMSVDEDEERRLDERPMHQGCMAGFLHLFDRPQILSGRRLHGSPRRLMSSGSSGSATPSERSMQLDRATPAPSSPDMTPPAAPRPSLQLPPLDLKDGGGGAGGLGGIGAAPSWRLPRLSLDSRAVVDARGKLRPREIRTSPAPGGAPPSPSAGDERRSPSVVARLMGLDALPHGQTAAGDGAHSGAASPAALRRSASERVPRDPSHFRFVDPAFFERPSSPLPPLMQRPSPSAAAAAAEAAMMRRAPPDPACPRAFQRRSRFDAHEVFPDPARRADPTAAGAHGEIALYGEIERRLRKRGIAEPARDLETLKQILEALQLKGLLHHAPPQPIRTAPPPPIVVMRPSSRALPQVQPAARLTPARRLRVDVDRARRPRSPDPSASPARSPASPARRGPHSPQRRVSPAQSPKQQPPPQPFRRPSGFDSAGARARIARRAAQNAAALSPDDEASTTFSDGGSSSSFSASSRWDLEPPDTRTDRVLERCGKLLSSIQAFTGGDAAGSDQQPSPVSVLDAAAFLADEESPSSSSGSKRAIDFSSSSVGRPKPSAATAASDPEDDEWALAPWPAVGPDAGGDPDYAYVAELVRLFGGARRLRDPADVYKAAEQGRPVDTWHHRMLLCGAVGEALERQRAACPWEPAAWLRGAELVDHVWAEVRRAGEPVALAAGEEDMNDVTCNAIRRDLTVDGGRWAPTQQGRRVVSGAEAAEAVLQIERLVFKDLVADTIRELADADRPLPRRKLVF